MDNDHTKLQTSWRCRRAKIGLRLKLFCIVLTYFMDNIVSLDCVRNPAAPEVHPRIHLENPREEEPPLPGTPYLRIEPGTFSLGGDGFTHSTSPGYYLVKSNRSTNIDFFFRSGNKLYQDHIALWVECIVVDIIRHA